MNFYKHYLGDYSRDTADLSLAEHGAYRLMLDHYYATERPLPAGPVALYRICGAFTKAEQAAVCKVADRFFPAGDDGMRHNKRADHEIQTRAVQVAVNRELGKRGGRPKKTEQKTESVSQSDSQLEPNHNPHHSQILPLPNGNGAAPDADPLFGNGLKFLTAKGVSEKNARSFLGLMRKSVGDVVAFELIVKAEREDVSDPIPWLRKAMGARTKDDKLRVAL